MSRSGDSIGRVFRQLARYALTAGAAAVVDLGGFVLLVAFDVAVAPAAAISFLVATLVNFALSARIVFGVAPTLRLYPRFLAAASVGFLINVGVTAATHAFGAPPVLAKLLGIGTAFLANFALNATFVFPGRPR